jgi:hypothetical protein
MARELFGRSWRITINTLQLTGHHAEFDITKTLKRDPNSCDLLVYNLSPEHRAELQELQPKAGSTRGIPVKIEAGYGADMSLLWIGDLRSVFSTRAGPDWATRLSSGDGAKAIQNSKIALPMGPKTEVATALRALVKYLGVDSGNLDSVANRIRLRSGGKTFPSAKILHGHTARVIDDIARSAELEWSIQDGAIQFLERGKDNKEPAFFLSPTTGLIESPTVSNEGELEAKLLMIPGVRPGRICVVESDTIKGQFRLEKCQYRGATWQQDWYITINGKRY